MGVRFLPDRSPFLGGGAWTPAALGASLLAWWDAERSDLITRAANAVSSWRDVVGGYNCIQATGTAQPIWSATSFNGRPGITFDGVDDELTLTGAPASFPITAAAGDIWVVADQVALVADATVRTAAGYGTGTGNNVRVLSRSVSGGVNRAAYSVSAAGATVNGVGNFSGRHVIRGIYDGTNVYVEIDGNITTAFATVAATLATRVRLGAAANTAASNFWNGGISAVLFTAALTTAQANQLRAYLVGRV